ncbi:Protein export cytoplasm protein SecA ATPase RNA helicase [Lutibaculum baratangense AMV1]|uniref:Protein export cytoplasm protein SecA ATPase RNA helicase n=1 Tax=Lutibaculum baratangense AMV1 TaxID=631454 RepID=V4RVK0_9HYPH|nr:Protein export cytoplasm protein SecA ATPase RNA helicase [Lutibaculum baratangense AMV1]
MIVPLTMCEMLLEEPGGGSRTVTIDQGVSYSREAGVEHNVVNGGDGPMSFIEVELKTPAG